MLKNFVQVSIIILWSFIAILQVFKVLERFNRSKVRSSNSIFALPATEEVSKLLIDMQLMANKYFLHQSACININKSLKY